MQQQFLQPAHNFFVDPRYQELLAKSGLGLLDAVFDYEQGQRLSKSNLAPWRQRIRLQLTDGQTVYLKRYLHPPLSVQLKNWLQHGCRAFLSEYDKGPLEELSKVNVPIPQTIAYGGQWTGLFEKRSFIITLEIPTAHSLETDLPDCFEPTKSKNQSKHNFIIKLADFVRRFHQTGYRHRDLYLCHIFLSDNKALYLIDLHRTFKPKLFDKRYQIKDLAQLHYSSPAGKVSTTDRLRFYLAYTQKGRLTPADKKFIRKIHAKADRITRHDRKHGRVAPFRIGSNKGRSS